MPPPPWYTYTYSIIIMPKQPSTQSGRTFRAVVIKRFYIVVLLITLKNIPII